MAVLSAEMTTSPSPPAHPHESDVWHNTLNGRSYSWTIGPSGRGAWVATPTITPKMPEPIPSDAPDITNPTPKITMANVPPLTPIAGDMWFDTVRGFLFVFYDDGNTTQWVVANPGRGGQEGPPGLPGSPSGPAGGDLFGFYPDPVIKNDVSLGGAPTTTTPTSGDSSTKISTTAFVQAAVALVPPIPVSLPPTGPAGGDLSGSYPNPFVKVDLALGGNPTAITQATTDNSQRLATTAFVKTNIAAIPAITVPVGSIAFGGAGGAVTGNSTLSWGDTGKNFAITGYTGAAAAFSIAGSVPASPAVDAFLMSIANPSNNSGNIFRLRAGAAGTTDQFKVDMFGDGAFSGSIQAFALSAPPAGGGNAFGIFLGNFTGGNIGLYYGTGAPTLNTFGKFGSIYMNAATPGLPWYNNNGTTGWDRLVGETSTQTLTNKTITGYLPSGSAAGGDLSGTYPNPTIKPSATNGQVLTTVAGVAAWAAASGGGASITVSDTPPGSPTAGALWWNSVLGTLMLWYTDPNTSQWVPASPSGTPNKLLQEISVETGAVATGSTLIPFDNTIPQQTEGDQYMALAITPQSATSKLIIEVVAVLTSLQAANNPIVVALFQDAAANALATAFQVMSVAGSGGPIGFRHTMTSGTTSATTFKVRAGGPAAGQMTFNGQNGAASMGGTMASSIVIREIAP